MKRLTSGQRQSVLYHNIFNYPLNEEELHRWASRRHKTRSKASVNKKKSYYFLKGREEIIKLREANERSSKRKLKIASCAAREIIKIPMIKLVAVSGSLAMNNAAEESDIDLLIVTSSNTLWITRPLVYFVLKLKRYKVRKPKDQDEKDKLCLNLWMDEQDLSIKQKNIYTAHELAQLLPLENKDHTYEKLLSANKWITEYWPSAVKIIDFEITPSNKVVLWKYINHLAFFFQKAYMSRKITREQVSLTRAFFHPRDWGKEVEIKLSANITSS